MKNDDFVNKAVIGLPFSGIRKIYELASTLGKEGKNIIHLEIGRPDFDTPKHIKEAAKDALDSGKVHYTSNYGLIELREAVSEKLFSDNNITVNPQDEIIVTSGVSEANFIIMASLLEKGDEVIVLTPCWPTYLDLPPFFGAKVVAIPMYTNHRFDIDFEIIEKSINKKTKLMIINSPSNPTGIVLSEKSIHRFAELAEQYNLLVLSDEIYEKIIYDKNKHISIASLPGMKKRAIVVNGFSKAYSMTGWRIGYVAASSDLIRGFIRVHQKCVTCASSISQHGAISALKGDQICVSDMVAEFDRRRRFLVDGLNRIPHVTCEKPDGTFYVFPDFREYNIDSEKLSLHLLEKAGVAVAPGGIFGLGGETRLRLSYTNTLENLSSAIEKISMSLNEIRI